VIGISARGLADDSHAEFAKPQAADFREVRSMSQQPLVIAYHLIWTMYGWWLPNDPRGSGSKTIRQDHLKDLGDIHFGRKQVQPAGRVVRQFQADAQLVLKCPLITLDERLRAAVATIFGKTIEREKYTCYACAIMPDHVHLLVRKHKDRAEDMIDIFKEDARSQLFYQGHVQGEHPIWASGSGWKVFLDHPDEVRRTIAYIEKNPTEIGLPLQTWPFVTRYKAGRCTAGIAQTHPTPCACAPRGAIPDYSLAAQRMSPRADPLSRKRQNTP
jgi:REP element-mobilizing transposase RayT